VSEPLPVTNADHIADDAHTAPVPVLFCTSSWIVPSVAVPPVLVQSPAVNASDDGENFIPHTTTNDPAVTFDPNATLADVVLLPDVPVPWTYAMAI
jgi:hypothetical protein